MILIFEKKAVILALFVFGMMNFVHTTLAFEEPVGKKEYIDFQSYTGNRSFVFNDTKIDYCIIKNDQNLTFNEIAKEAVEEWHDKIIEVTNNTDVWDMEAHIYPKDDSICDGFINYLDTPDQTYFQLAGVVGFSQPSSYIANITIYADDYQSTLQTMSKQDESFWDNLTLAKFHDIIKNSNHKQFDSGAVKRITLHEIGHSLSLNHPSPDNSLQNASGIMGYNMSYSKIDDSEVLDILRAYPNGFAKISKPQSISLDGNYEKKVLTVGEVTNLTIEMPSMQGKLPSTGIELYIFPTGTTSQKPENAPIKIIQTENNDLVQNDEKFLANIQSALVHWNDQTKVLSVQFTPVAEFENADVIVIADRAGGFEDQWFLDDVLSSKKALFSNLLLNLGLPKTTFHLNGSNPNREIENESIFRINEEKKYEFDLHECLLEKNMKKCMEEIKIENYLKNS